MNKEQKLTPIQDALYATGKIKSGFKMSFRAVLRGENKVKNILANYL